MIFDFLSHFKEKNDFVRLNSWNLIILIVYFWRMNFVVYWTENVIKIDKIVRRTQHWNYEIMGRYSITLMSFRRRNFLIFDKWSSIIQSTSNIDDIMSQAKCSTNRMLYFLTEKPLTQINFSISIDAARSRVRISVHAKAINKRFTFESLA